jgi:3-methyladenine DNA glycosylase AlkD
MTELTAADISAVLRQRPPANTPAWRVLLRDWSAVLAAESPKAVIKLAEQLVGRGTWERLTAYELVANHPRGILELEPASVHRLAKGLCDWPGVDTFGCYVAGPAWRDGHLPTRDVQGWACSPDRWQRRLALVCTVALNVRARGGQGDAPMTLRICRQLIEDRDDMVVKALSWALRALVSRDREAVRQFFAAHDAGLAARVTREVGNKLRTGLKNPRLGNKRVLQHRFRRTR